LTARREKEDATAQAWTRLGAEFDMIGSVAAAVASRPSVKARFSELPRKVVTKTCVAARSRVTFSTFIEVKES
jgi:hypothetical protein